MRQYYKLIKPITACIAENPRAQKTVTPTTDQGRPRICFVDSKPIPTGLTAPNVEYLYTLIISGIATGIPNLLITKDQMVSYLEPMYQIQAGDTFTTLKELAGSDNCISQSSAVSIPKGTTLTAKNSQSTSRGHYFFDFNGVSVNLHNFHVQHPYGMPIVESGIIEIHQKGVSE